MTKHRENILLTTFALLSVISLIYLGQNHEVADASAFLPLDKLVTDHYATDLLDKSADVLSGLEKIISLFR